MINIQNTARFISRKRRSVGLTQEQLANLLNISPQAVSKWENAHALPDTALLPELAKALHTSIDLMLTPGELFIIKAALTDGGYDRDITAELSREIESDEIHIANVSRAFEKELSSDRFLYLIVHYQYGDAEAWTYAPQDGSLAITKTGEVLPDAGSRVIEARYGNAENGNDATNRLNHMLVFGYSSYLVNHHTFDSNPNASGGEWLTLLYANSSGLHVVNVPENHHLKQTIDGYESVLSLDKKSVFIPDISPLGFGENMDCTWAGAMTRALNVLGFQTNYEDVMGASGACFRINFLHPTWDYSSVDALIVHDHDVPLFYAYGLEIIVGRPQKEHRDEERRHILRDLDDGKPILCINPRVAHEWGLITGYKIRQDDSVEFWCRSYFEDPKESNDLLGNENYYAVMENWPFIIQHFGNSRKPMPPRDLILQKSLETFIDCATTLELHRGYASGISAYATWRDALMDETAFSRLDESVFRRRMGVNQFCMLALTDARRAASIFLRRYVDSVPATALENYLKICESFELIHQMLAAFFPRVPDPDCPLSPAPLSEWTQALRHDQAKLLDECLSLEQLALEHARKALEKWGD